MVISYLKASKAIPKTAAKMQLTSPNMDLGDFLTVTPIEKKPTQKIYPTPKHCNFTSNNHKFLQYRHNLWSNDLQHPEPIT